MYRYGGSRLARHSTWSANVSPTLPTPMKWIHTPSSDCGVATPLNVGNAFAELRNLLDEEYVATLSVLNEAAPDARVLYPGAPRSAYAGVRLRF